MSSDWFRGQAIPRGMPLPRWGRCDSCGAVNVPVRAMGRDSNGEPDAPDLCGVCRDEEDGFNDD